MENSSPLLLRSDHSEASVFRVENLLREARRQLQLAGGTVPEVCLLDPDGDIARYVESTGAGKASPIWACYHTSLYETAASFGRLGIVPFAVGAPFAVLVAEELFSSGCKFLISLSSAGRISPNISHSCYVVIDKALRGEGTSLAYVPAGQSILADQALAGYAYQMLSAENIPVVRGASWTTDAPFRETECAIATAASQGALTVEMEAAALYAFAQASGAKVLCLAHITNDMAVETGDFEKGACNGAEQAMRIVEIIAASCYLNHHETAESP